MTASAKKALFLREMPTELVREAKAYAARRGQTLTRVVADALSRSLGVADDGGQSSALALDIQWYAKHRERLTREYPGEYVAIIDGEIVDHARDFDVLARRVFGRYGSRNVYMPFVQVAVCDSEPVHVRSPRMRS